MFPGVCRSCGVSAAFVGQTVLRNSRCLAKFVKFAKLGAVSEIWRNSRNLAQSAEFAEFLAEAGPVRTGQQVAHAMIHIACLLPLRCPAAATFLLSFSGKTSFRYYLSLESKHAAAFLWRSSRNGAEVGNCRGRVAPHLLPFHHPFALSVLLLFLCLFHYLSVHRLFRTIACRSASWLPSVYQSVSFWLAPVCQQPFGGR